VAPLATDFFVVKGRLRNPVAVGWLPNHVHIALQHGVLNEFITFMAEFHFKFIALQHYRPKLA
jgi:hypothetical protein